MNRARNKSGYFSHIVKVNEMIGPLYRREIKIPVELCFFVLRHKILAAFRIYILLKMTCSGKIKLEPDVLRIFSEFCGYTTIKSFKHQIKRLISLNWVGYNKSSNIYHIRGFRQIQKQHELKSRTGFWFTIQDMQAFDGVVYGAVIGYLSKSQGKNQRVERQRGSSNQTLCKSPGFFPVSNLALAKILNISVSTASIMKRRAEEEATISIKRKRIIEPATSDVYKRLKEAYPEKYLNYIVWKHRIYRRFPDLIKAGLKYGTRKKIDK